MSKDNPKKGAKKEEKGRKKITKRGLLKEDVRGFGSVEAFEILSQGRDLESGGDLSWEDLLDKTEDLSDRESEAWVVVLVSPSSVLTEFCDGLSCCSDWEFVEPQKEMRYESSQVKAPPMSRRRMMPPTPLQSSYSSFEEEHNHSKWTTRCGVRETEQLLQERNGIWKKVKI